MNTAYSSLHEHLIKIAQRNFAKGTRFTATDLGKLHLDEVEVDVTPGTARERAKRALEHARIGRRLNGKGQSPRQYWF